MAASTRPATSATLRAMSRRTRPDWGEPRRAVPPKLGGFKTSVSAAHPLVRWTKMSGRPSTPTVVAEPASRIASAAAQLRAPVKTAKIEIGSASTCSGGADGGMDATGNQCGEAPAAVAINLVAHRIKR